MKFKLACRKCKKIPTKRSRYQNDSWDYELCPSCYAHEPLRNLVKIIKPIDDSVYFPVISSTTKKNPIDIYWNLLTDREVMRQLTKEVKCNE